MQVINNNTTTTKDHKFLHSPISLTRSISSNDQWDCYLEQKEEMGLNYKEQKQKEKRNLAKERNSTKKALTLNL